MRSFTSIANCLLGIFAALLILIQSLFAVGLSSSCATKSDDHHPKKTEVQQEVTSKASYVDVATRVTLATFLFYWVAKVFALLDVPVIKYQNCRAFFVNAHSFNSYYTHLSALAP